MNHSTSNCACGTPTNSGVHSVTYCGPDPKRLPHWPRRFTLRASALNPDMWLVVNTQPRYVRVSSHVLHAHWLSRPEYTLEECEHVVQWLNEAHADGRLR